MRAICAMSNTLLALRLLGCAAVPGLTCLGRIKLNSGSSLPRAKAQNTLVTAVPQCHHSPARPKGAGLRSAVDVHWDGAMRRRSMVSRVLAAGTWIMLVAMALAFLLRWRGAAAARSDVRRRS
jgi:hypothetical protein